MPRLAAMTGFGPAIQRRRFPSRLALGVAARVREWKQRARLLQFHLGASLFELGLDLVGFVLVDAFLDRLRRAFDEVLGFLEAQAGDGADFLDDLDLLVAGSGEHDRELGLLFSRSSGSATASWTGDGHRSRCGYAPLFLEELCQLGSFEHGKAREVVDDFL